MPEVNDAEAVSVEDQVPHTGPSLLQGRPVRAMAAVSLRDTELAIWLIGLTGEPCGAWILDATEEGAALTAMNILDRRALVEREPGDAQGILEDLAQRIGIAAPTTTDRCASLTHLLEATEAARVAYQEFTAQPSATARSKRAALSWPTPLPKMLTETESSVRRAWSRAGDPPDAFRLAISANRLMQLWAETESTRVRRTYLREEFGEAQPLPEGWRAAALAAFDEPFDLPEKAYTSRET